jgi:hypothetical protein
VSALAFAVPRDQRSARAAEPADPRRVARRQGAGGPALHADALAQLNLLLDASDDQHADFYSYRYFASEGFLPGYNFPRLPLSAFLPGPAQAPRARPTTS